MRYAVILAGGQGRRLWPMSRSARPKQLLPLLEGKSLLEVAVERLSGSFAPEAIYVITNAEYAAATAQALPQLPPGHVVGEPVGRDTAPAVALAAAILGGVDPAATMAVFTADHIIRPVEAFLASVDRACGAAEADRQALVTFGVRATWPHTGLGYIEAGQYVGEGVFAVAGFKEKPDHQAARQYVESGKHYWNSGMFVWTLEAIQGALREFLPETARRLEPVTRAVRDGGQLAPLLAEVYPALTKISIDYAVMERARTVRMVELGCEWLDVGSWPALGEVSELDDDGNVVLAENAVVLDSERNVIVSEDAHLLAVMGMDDCVIVHTPDATLICRKGDSQRLKALVDQVSARYGQRYE
ncbi:MAG: sugar phosphate nucleotidyltransferase [Planctomycetota bacterium]|nr:sugar phosphate nucleotidyltransferase [Planctomycetota bacterium]